MKSLQVLASTILFSAALAHADTPCASLKHLILPASSIALPTNGARVLSAHSKTTNNIPFCKVLGVILPIDPAADPIRFELNLPTQWNHKAVQFGGGAFDGYIVTGLGPGTLGDKHSPTPLQRGFATFGSDSGHHHHYLLLPDITNAISARFALNDEQRHNFASDQLKKTHDTVLAIISARYGTPAARMYFLGGSTGGREAMKVVDRWPADYDGVLAAYAAWNQVESDLQFIAISRALYNRDPHQSGWLTKHDTRLLQSAVLHSCDAADGLSDGLISDPSACHFDPATLRCDPTLKSHHNCLTDTQLRTVAAFSSTFTSNFAVPSGLTSEPGYNVLSGADLTGSLGLFRHAFHPAIPLFNSFQYVVADGVLRFFLTKDPHFNALTFDPVNATSPNTAPGHWLPGIREQALEDDAPLADLTPFASHGGKLLLVHGTADTTIPTGASILLYQRIVAAMGQPAADAFLRLYLIPGFGHGRGPFNAAFDPLSVLDTWATTNTPPSNLTVTDQDSAQDSAHNSARTRPLCAFPTIPRYTSGDPNLASSFTCSTSSQPTQNSLR
jgi:hypothetical protein